MSISLFNVYMDEVLREVYERGRSQDDPPRSDKVVF